MKTKSQELYRAKNDFFYLLNFGIPWVRLDASGRPPGKAVGKDGIDGRLGIPPGRPPGIDGRVGNAGID